MKISIAQRYRPFSHELGSSCLIPLSCWAVEAYPTMIFLKNFETNDLETIEIPLSIHGPVREFTLQLDLESGCVWVSGEAKEGRYRFCFRIHDQKIEMLVKTAPLSGMVIQGCVLKKSEILTWPIWTVRNVKRLERLSLGSHREQAWPAIWRRMDPMDILPILYHLSQWTPEISSPNVQMESLIDSNWKNFLMAAFRGILLPRLSDNDFQGLLDVENILPNTSPIGLISVAGKKIRSLFIQQNGEEIQLLPHSSFVCGRMTNIALDQIGTLDLEWTKNMPRIAVLHAETNAKIRLSHTCRIRQTLDDRGDVASELEMRMNTRYLLDRFQK